MFCQIFSVLRSFELRPKYCWASKTKHIFVILSIDITAHVYYIYIVYIHIQLKKIVGILLVKIKQKPNTFVSILKPIVAYQSTKQILNTHTTKPLD